MKKDGQSFSRKKNQFFMVFTQKFEKTSNKFSIVKRKNALEVISFYRHAVILVFSWFSHFSCEKSYYLN